jgi:hypothetical protein
MAQLGIYATQARDVLRKARAVLTLPFVLCLLFVSVPKFGEGAD